MALTVGSEGRCRISSWAMSRSSSYSISSSSASSSRTSNTSLTSACNSSIGGLVERLKTAVTSNPLFGCRLKINRSDWDPLSAADQLLVLHKLCSPNIKRYKILPSQDFDAYIIQAMPRVTHERAVRTFSKNIDNGLEAAVGDAIFNVGSQSIYVSTTQSRRPDDSWTLRDSYFQEPMDSLPRFVIEVGSSQDMASLDALADEYLTGQLAEKIHGVLTICIDALPKDSLHLQPRISFDLHTNSLVNRHWIRRKQHLHEHQGPSTEDFSLNIPAYLFAAKDPATLPADLQALATLQLLDQPAINLEFCRQIVFAWRQHKGLPRLG